MAKTLERVSGFVSEMFNTEYEKQYVPFDELMEAFEGKFDIFADDELVLASEWDTDEDDDEG